MIASWRQIQKDGHRKTKEEDYSREISSNDREE